MRVRDRTERRLADRSAVREPANAAAKRPLVLERELHEQVVRVLAIVNGVAVAGLTGRKQIGIPAAADRPRLGTEHRAHANATAAGLAAAPCPSPN